MPQGHKAKTGNAPIRKVGHTNGSRYGQDASARTRGSNSGSEHSYK